jgi:hypothetical protein
MVVGQKWAEVMLRERKGASGSEVVKDLNIYYRTANMEEPVLLA